MKNACYTYFRICGDFDPHAVSTLLDLHPFYTHKKGDPRKDGKTVYDFAAWHFGKCESYDTEVDRQMRETVGPLLGKTAILNKLRAEYDVSFSLEIVPSVHAGEATPCLAPSLEIMRFCCETETAIDIDLYVC